jgi:hemoglobin-like flavoprotein
MASDRELIHDSMEKVAAKVGDLSAAVYERFFRLHPEAQSMFGADVGNVAKGNMLTGIFCAVMDQAEGISDDDRTFFWASDHVAYDATLPMYPAMFGVLLETLKECLREDWNEAVASAWGRQFDRMMNPIKKAYAETSHVTR